jgi:hypothetical protein
LHNSRAAEHHALEDELAASDNDFEHNVDGTDEDYYYYYYYTIFV